MRNVVCCLTCKFFKLDMVPEMSWDERVKFLMETHGLDTETAGFLATNRLEMFKMKESSVWGKCSQPLVPQLRDVPMKGDSFGCMYHKVKKIKIEEHDI